MEEFVVELVSLGEILLLHVVPDGAVFAVGGYMWFVLDSSGLGE